MSKKNVFLPDFMAEDLLHVDWDSVISGGKIKVMLDIDNTLVLHGRDVPDEYAKRVVAELKARPDMELMILSNSRAGRAEKFAKALNLPFIGAAGKPFSAKLLRLKKEAVFGADDIVVGDQLFTDVLAAKYLGTKVILVKPRSLAEETVLIKIKRVLESLIYYFMDKSLSKVVRLPRLRENPEGCGN